jgi:hypothetical protein
MSDLDGVEYNLKSRGGFSDAPPTFSSWPNDQEESFRVYEERMRNADKSARNLGLFVGLGFGALCLVVVIAFWGDVDKSMGIHGGPMTEAPVTKPAPAATTAPAATPPAAPTAAPAAAPAPTAPAETPATPK